MTGRTPKIRHLHPPELAPPPGYSNVVEVTGSRLVFIAGQTALDREGNLVGGNNLEAQADQAFRNVGYALAAAGCTAPGAASGASIPAVFAAVPDDPNRRAQLPSIGSGVTAITREEFERFAERGGEILTAPIAVVARALNMLSASPTGRRESAITVVGLCVRPVMPVTEPAELAANVAAHAYRDSATSTQPAELLDHPLAITRGAVRDPVRPARAIQ